MAFDRAHPKANENNVFRAIMSAVDTDKLVNLKLSIFWLKGHFFQLVYS